MKTLELNDVEAIAKVMLVANHEFNKAWDQWFEEQKILPEDRFWDICFFFFEEVWKFRFEYKRTDGVQDACREFMRKAFTGEAKYTLDEAIRFAKTYDYVNGKLEKRYAKGFPYIGDGFGDLMDSLPLMGKECMKLPVDEDEIRKAVLAHFGGKMEKMGKFIVNGENYIEMRLKEKARQYWLVALRQKRDDISDDMDIPEEDD